MHLLDQRWIPGETFGIQIAHLVNQRLQLVPCLRTVLHSGTKLVEKVQSLFNLVLCVGRVRPLQRSHGLPLNASIAGVPTAALIAIAIAATGRVTHRTSHAVADFTGQTALLTTSTTLPLLTTLTLLTALARLLALLTIPARLALSRLAVALTVLLRTPAETGHLVAQTG
jgi:hypothetical protein